jgi:hypothetical protein
VISEIFLLVEQVGSRTAQVYDLGTAVPVFLQPCTLETVEGVRNSLTAAYNTFILVIAERAFVADAGKSSRAHVRVANRAFAVTFVAEATDGYAGLFAAHYKIASMC